MNAVLSPQPLAFREMLAEDVEAVMAVEVEAYPHPWTKVIFRDCLRAGYHGILASCDEGMAGYAMISVAVGEAHLLNLCVRPDLQGRGYGRQLLHRVFDEAESRGAGTIFLEVRSSNTVAQSLYIDNGFNRIGTRPGYYPDHKGREDALVYAKHLFGSK